MVDTIQNIGSTIGSDPGVAAAVNLNRNTRSEKEDSVKAANLGGSKKAAPVKTQPSADVSGVVADINKIVYQVATTKISFDIDEETGQSIIRVLNRETGDIIRQLPTEELLNLISKMEQLRGLIFDREI